MSTYIATDGARVLAKCASQSVFYTSDSIYDWLGVPHDVDVYAVIDERGISPEIDTAIAPALALSVGDKCASTLERAWYENVAHLIAHPKDKGLL